MSEIENLNKVIATLEKFNLFLKEENKELKDKIYILESEQLQIYDEDVVKNVDIVVDVKQKCDLLLAINSVLNTSIILFSVYSVFSFLRRY